MLVGVGESIFPDVFVETPCFHDTRHQAHETRYEGDGDSGPQKPLEG